MNASATMKQAFRSADSSRNPGSARRASSPSARHASGPIQFPVVIINGADDGPVLCLTAGVHATEYAPIDAVMRIVQSLDAGTLRGAVIAVPVVNMRMFESRAPFVSPLDGLNLNKAAPGRADGTISEMLAQRPAGRGHRSRRLPYRSARRRHGGDAVAVRWLRAHRHARPRRGRRGTGATLFPEADFARDADRADSSVRGRHLFRGDAARHRVDLRRVGRERHARGGGRAHHVDGVTNVMRHLRMVDGAPAAVGDRLAARDRKVVRATRAGLLRLRSRSATSRRRAGSGRDVQRVRRSRGDGAVERCAASPAWYGRTRS